MSERIVILCVDDEPNVLEGLTLHLRRKYQVLTATSGSQGLELLRAHPEVAVVVSDMRMPGMDGAAFLKEARATAPDATRVLLTGQADLASAISAVNDGQIFRFLTKPLPPEQLQVALAAAVEMNRLVTAERVLLEQTLRGSIEALTDILALTNPLAFGRASRIQTLASELAGALSFGDRWQLDVAAMLSQIGFVTLPMEVVEKAQYARPLSDSERALVDRVPAITEQLLAHIPRLDAVRAMLARLAQRTWADPRAAGAAVDPVIDRGAQILRVALDYDTLESNGDSPAEAIDTMRAHSNRYAGDVLDALTRLRGESSERQEVRELRLGALREGMTLVEDLKLPSGILLAARGFTVSRSLVARIDNSPPEVTAIKIHVIVPPESRAAEAKAA